MRNSTRQKILLIVQSEEDIRLFRTILESIHFEVSIVRNGEIAIQRFYEHQPDLIICQNELNDLNGFQVFNQLKNRLLKKGVPFFLYMNHFNKDDVLIGLEMGMDNFIMSPVEPSALINKIETQFQKLTESKFFDSRKFGVYFESTPVARFTLKNNRLMKANSAFRRLFNIYEDSVQSHLISDIFDLSDNYANELNFRKCINGLVQKCYLKEVKAVHAKNLTFDIHFCNCDNSEQGYVIADVVPANMFDHQGLKENTTVKLNSGNGVEEIKGNKHEILFTTREQEVLTYSAQGLPIKQIAAVLNVSNRTVEKHRANIMKKIGSNNIIEAILVARANNRVKPKIEMV